MMREPEACIAYMYTGVSNGERAYHGYAASRSRLISSNLSAVKGLPPLRTLHYGPIILVAEGLLVVEKNDNNEPMQTNLCCGLNPSPSDLFIPTHRLPILPMEPFPLLIAIPNVYISSHKRHVASAGRAIVHTCALFALVNQQQL